MPNLPISGLPVAGVLANADLIEIVQDTGGGTLDNFKVDLSTLRTYYQGTLPQQIIDNGVLIGNNATAIGNNTSAIGSNTSAIGTNTSDIANLQGETSGYTNGSVIFADTDGTFTENNTNFKWDNIAKVLRIGSTDNLKIGNGLVDGLIEVSTPSSEANRAKMFVKNSNGQDGFATWVYLDEDGYTYESRESSLRVLGRFEFDKNVGKTHSVGMYGGERIEKISFNDLIVIETIDFAVRKNSTSSNGTSLFQTVSGATTADKLTNLNNWIMGGASIGTEIAPSTGQDFQLLITCELYIAWFATGYVNIEVRIF